MNDPQPLTRLAHDLLARVLQPGDRAIDATAGNGHDTLFLAQRVTPGGEVFAFDVQTRALDATALRLEEEGLRESAYLCHTGHQNMQQRIPQSWNGQVTAITFNLGYLPGSDKRTTTQAESTVAALQQSLQLLRTGGVLSILAYRGHEGGQIEADAVESWLNEHQQELQWQRHESAGPVLHHCVTL